MGPRRVSGPRAVAVLRAVIGGLAVAACAARTPAPSTAPTVPGTLRDRVVADFAHAVATSRDAYLGLFDFDAVGEVEILLHRYDLLGRLPLDASQRAAFAAEDGTPYPAARERRNVGNFYAPLAQRTVGPGGCEAVAPRTRYATLLGEPSPPLPAGTPPGYALLRTHANAWLGVGGVVGIRCAGGRGGVALVYTARDTPRGYDLITIYDD